MRLHDPERFLRPSARPLEVGVGLIVGLPALLFLYLATYVVVWGLGHGFLEKPFQDRGWLEFMIVPAVLLALGIPGAWIAYRLVTGRRRRDGGLLPPSILRLSGTLLIVAPWLWLLGNPADPWRWSHAVSLTSAGVACWILAARREHRDAPDPAISVAAHEPLG